MDTLRWFEEAVAVADKPWAQDVRKTKFLLQPIGEAAIALCEACADLLFEPRVLPP